MTWEGNFYFSYEFSRKIELFFFIFNMFIPNVPELRPDAGGRLQAVSLKIRL